MNYAAAHSGAGDTVIARGLPSVAGVYDESFQDNLPSGTAWNNTWRLMAYPGETVWMRPTDSNIYVIYLALTQRYIELDGINIDARFNAAGAPVKLEGYITGSGNPHHIRIQNATFLLGSDNVPNQGTDGGPIGVICTNSAAGIIGANEFINLTMTGGGDVGDFSYSFYIQSDNNLIDGCNLYNNEGAGIQVYNGHGQTANNNIIRNCSIHDQTRSPDTRVWGIILASGSATQVYNNIFYNNGGSGDSASIFVYNGTGHLLYNNSISNGTAYGIKVDTNASGTKVYNNISYGNAQADYVNVGSGTLALTNMFSGVDPKWVNPGAGDLHLQATSPAINAGTTIALVTTDKDGYSRPQGSAYCIGAYEFPTVTPSQWTRIAGVTGTGDASFRFVQTGAINTTGATIIWISLGRYVVNTTSVTVSDSKSNTWTPLTRQTSAGGFASQLYYCINPIVGSGHTFRAEHATLAIFPSMEVEAWDGPGSITFGGQNGNVAAPGVASVQTGSVTPDTTDSILIAGVGNFGSNGPTSINLAFAAATVDAAANYGGSSIAYLVLPFPAAKNPTWDLTAGDGYGFPATIAWWKSAPSGFGALLADSRNQRVM